MKTSLDHLPARKQTQLHSLVRLIIEHAAVEMIILFGSHARGDWVEDHAQQYFSDYDVLVVTETTKQAEDDDLWSAIENKARVFLGDTELTLITHSIKDVNYQLEHGWFFLNDVVKEGILLYSSGRFELATPRPKSSQERYQYAKEGFALYYERANRMYWNYETNFHQSWYNEAAFMLHQATETFYKTTLIVFTTYRPKTHNIATLNKMCANLYPPFRTIFPLQQPDDKRRFKLLKAAYVDARYSLSYSISREDLETLAIHVGRLRELTSTACHQALASMAPPPPPAE